MTHGAGYVLCLTKVPHSPALVGPSGLICIRAGFPLSQQQAPPLPQSAGHLGAGTGFSGLPSNGLPFVWECHSALPYGYGLSCAFSGEAQGVGLSLSKAEIGNIHTVRARVRFAKGWAKCEVAACGVSCVCMSARDASCPVAGLTDPPTPRNTFSQLLCLLGVMRLCLPPPPKKMGCGASLWNRL